MGHEQCVNGHHMWDGDGKPCVYIYNLPWLTKALKERPEAMYWQVTMEDGKKKTLPIGTIYDVVDYLDFYPDDGWFCDECNTLRITSLGRPIDYEMDNELNENDLLDYSKWDTYIAPRDEEYGEFLEFESEMARKNITLDKVLEMYKFKYYYRVSDDLKHIYAFNTEGKYCFAMKQIRIL